MAAIMSDSNEGRLAASPRARAPVWPFAAVIVGLALLGVADMARSMWTAGAVDLRGVRSRLVWEEGRKVLLIAGEIANPRRASVSVSPIRLSVRDRQGLDLYSWTIVAPRAVLAAGDRAPFQARLVAPPEEGVETLARFESAGAAASPTTRPVSAAPRPQRLASAAAFRAVARDDIPNLRKMP